MTPILEVDGIHTAYGTSRVLFGISLDMKPGECVCLLGRNGVGKTTTMRSIMGLTPPSQGRVRFKGEDITGSPPYRLARRGMGYAPLFAPYLERPCLRSETPAVSSAARMTLYRMPGRSLTRPPRMRTTECSCRLCPSPGM